MSTESNQSSENRHIDVSLEEERQRTGLYRWDDPENLMPPWSVPAGLMVPGVVPGMVPGPRDPEADAPPPVPGPEPAVAAPAADGDSWPGVAPPAGWFLHAPEPPPAAQPESAPASPQPPAKPWPAGGAWPNSGPVPSPTREPDGSWSSPVTPKPAPRALGPTPARYGRAGGPGFQAPRLAQPRTAGLSPWQRSHQLWTEAGVQWEQPPAPQPRPVTARQAPPPASPRHAPGRHIRPGLYAPERPGPYEPAAVGWPGPIRVPLGAPVFSDPRVDEDEGPTREDRWGDDQPPIRKRPPGLLPPAEPSEPREARTPRAPRQTRAEDTLLLDHRMPGSRPPGPGRLGRRTATIAVPAIVLAAVAVLALALLTGHGPKFGPLTANQHKTQKPVAPRLPLAAVTFDTYPGQQQRGVFQSINRVVAVGNTIVTMGSQASDGAVRQQFLVSTNAGASWSGRPAAARLRSVTRPRCWPAARAAGWRSARRPSGPARPA